jgi:BlaI family transcriptional regulator, penicillinase repressor
MTNTQRIRPKNLSNVEQLVMDYVWSHGPCTAEACREQLVRSCPMKDSTIRTVLRRLEAKGYVTHQLEGRTFLYRAAEARVNVAARAVKHIIDRFCDGSAEQLVMGMVDSKVLGRKDLERLARKIAQSREGQRKPSAKPAAPSSGKDDKP